MDNNNLPQTARVVNLLEELGEKEGQRAVLLTGPYTPDYVAKVAQDLLFEIAEIGAEIVQIVRDLESASAEGDEDAAPSKPRWGDVSGQVRLTTTL